jgi:hypothetical protein
MMDVGMVFEDSTELLNELLVHHYRSLPMFLTEASPWTHRGDEKATDVVMDIVADQKATCQRLAALVEQRGGVVDVGEYPMDFLELHFLSLDYMLQLLVQHQRNEVAWIQRCSERLWNDPPAQAVAKEALGAARGHLQSLEELTASASSSS